MTAATTTAVLAAGEGPGLTAAVTTAALATGAPMTPRPARPGPSGMSGFYGFSGLLAFGALLVTVAVGWLPLREPSAH